jgi:hypothetical protein
MKLEDKQTAVEWLFRSLWDTPKDKLTWWAIFDEAMAIEKEQIIDAYDNGFASGFDDGKYDDEPKYPGAEQYYDDNYAN